MTQINDIITDENEILYAETAIWCNENNAVLEEIEPENGKRRFQVKSIPEPTIEEKNEQIRLQRQSRFATESDPLYLDYVEAQARLEAYTGTSTKKQNALKKEVTDSRKAWLNKKDEIREQLPKIDE